MKQHSRLTRIVLPIFSLGIFLAVLVIFGVTGNKKIGFDETYGFKKAEREYKKPERFQSPEERDEFQQRVEKHENHYRIIESIVNIEYFPFSAFKKGIFFDASHHKREEMIIQRAALVITTNKVFEEGTINYIAASTTDCVNRLRGQEDIEFTTKEEVRKKLDEQLEILTGTYVEALDVNKK